MTSFTGSELWDQVEAVDPAFTKVIQGREFKGDTVNVNYTLKKLTKALGPAGLNWGWEVVGEKVHEYGSHEYRDFVAIHSIRVRLWLRREDGSTGSIEDYGTTKLAYYTSQGVLKVDEEATKKSISDAKSKLFLSLGGSAEVWLGHFDRTQHKFIDQDESDNASRQTRQTRPAPTKAEAAAARQKAATDLPPDRDSTPTYMLDGRPLEAVAWIDAAGKRAKEQNGHLKDWWDTHKAVRAKLYKERPDLRNLMLALKAEVDKRLAAKAEAKPAAGVPPTMNEEEYRGSVKGAGREATSPVRAG